MGSKPSRTLLTLQNFILFQRNLIRRLSLLGIDQISIRQNHQQEKGRCHQPYRHGVCQYLNGYNNIEYEKIAR